MPDTKLVCPHCGHDGTPSTATSGLECYGFTYLEDDVVSREIEGFDAEGRLLLANKFRSESTQGANPRIECRSCWQTFLAPEGMAVVVAEAPAGTALEEGYAGVVDLPLEAVPAAPGGVGDMARRMAGNLVDLLTGAIQQAQRKVEADFKGLQNTVAGLSAVVGGLPALIDDIAALRAQTGSFAEAERQLSFKLVSLEESLGPQAENQERIQQELQSVSSAQAGIRSALAAQTGIMSNLEEATAQFAQTLKSQQELIEQQAAASAGVRSALGQVEESQQALRGRLDKQADAIRALHVAAQVQAGRREELRAALQKLEEIAGEASLPQSLPQEL